MGYTVIPEGTMDGNEFWKKIDLILKGKNLTLSDLAVKTGVGRSTIYRQRERGQLPKMDDFQKIERFLDTMLLERNDDFSEHEVLLISAYRAMPVSVRDAIDRMLGIEKKEENGNCIKTAD